MCVNFVCLAISLIVLLLLTFMQNGWTALHYASEHGSVTGVSVLVNGGANVNIQAEVPLTILYAFVMQENLNRRQGRDGGGCYYNATYKP